MFGCQAMAAIILLLLLIILIIFVVQLEVHLILTMAHNLGGMTQRRLLNTNVRVFFFYCVDQ